jgi:predicted transcriptional regulator
MNTNFQSRIEASIKELAELKKEATGREFLRQTIIGVIDTLARAIQTSNEDLNDEFEYTRMKGAIEKIMKEQGIGLSEVSRRADIARTTMHSFMTVHKKRDSEVLNKLRLYLNKNGYNF